MTFGRIEAVEPLAGDASSRRYRRVRLPGGRLAIEVVYPPGEESVLGRDLEVRAWLEAHGVRVPALLAADVGTGRALLEDLGRTPLSALLARASGGRRLEIAEATLAPLETLARLDPAALPPWNEPLGERRLRWELTGFELWFLRYGHGIEPSPAVRDWLDRLASRLGRHPRRVCHRDYHPDNLFLLPDGTTAVIDFQDLLVGPDTYDVASFLGDRDTPELFSPEDRERLARRWAERTGAGPGWEERLAETSVQRGLKVLGTFARLTACGRPAYGRWIGPLQRRMAEAAVELGAPEALTAWLRRPLPPGWYNAGERG